MSDRQEAVALARTPLYDLALEAGARMTAFSGWEMPVQFAGITKEHHAVRQQAGIFDISHMGKFVLSGKGVLDQLQTLVPSNLKRLQPGMAQYTVLLNEQGGILDDLIIYDQGVTEAGEEQVVLIVNAATRNQDKAWLLAQLELSQVELHDRTVDQVLLAVQGPRAIAALQPLVACDLAPIPAFGHVETTCLGAPAFIARTGYTGEDGVEVMVDPAVGIELWQSLVTAGVVPCGLGARDTLRLEAALCLYGQDITPATTPLEAGLGWIVHLTETGDFIGRAALEQQQQAGVTKRLVGLHMQGRSIARHDYPVLHDEQVVGVVTSGTLSPTLGYPIALAYLPTALAKVGQTVMVEIRGKHYPATVVKRPFYRRSTV